MKTVWTPTSDKKFAVVIADFDRPHLSNAICLRIGDTVQILEECGAWLRGFNVRNRKIKGIFPINHVAFKPCILHNEGPFETVFPTGDHMAIEITEALREFHDIWKKRYENGEASAVKECSSIYAELVELRRHLQSGCLASKRLEQLRARAAALIDSENKRLGLELVPRDKLSHTAHEENCSLFVLYEMHRNSEESIRSEPGSSLCNCKKNENNKANVHVQLVGLETNESNANHEIWINIFDSTDLSFTHEFFKCASPVDSAAVLFTDLFHQNTGKKAYNDLYLVVQVFKKGYIIPAASNLAFENGDIRRKNDFNGNESRRPFGCAVLCISDVQSETVISEPQIIKFYAGSDSEFPTLHEMLLRKTTGKAAQQINSVLKLHVLVLNVNCDAECPKMANLALSRPLQNTLIMPGDKRSEFMVTVENAEFEKAGKGAKHVEVILQLVDDKGKPIDRCMRSSCDGEPMCSYKSTLMPYCSTTKWMESVSVIIPADLHCDEMAKLHLRFLFNQASGADKQDRKLIAFAILPLISLNIAISNTFHCLNIFKCDSLEKMRDPSKYLALPWQRPSVGDKETLSSCPFQLLQKSCLRLKTQLYSSKISQQTTLCNFLKLTNLPDTCSEAIRQLCATSTQDIYMMLEIVLNKLFSMLQEEQISRNSSNLVFSSLMHVVYLSKADPNYRKALDAYLKDSYAFCYMAWLLMEHGTRSVNKVLECHECHNSDHVISCSYLLDNLDWLFRFSVRSEILKQKSGNGTSNPFLSPLKQFFECLSDFCRATNHEKFLKLQLIILRSIDTVFPILLEIISVPDVCSCALIILQSIESDSFSVQQFDQAKLEFLARLVECSLFQNYDSHKILLHPIVRIVRSYLKRRDQLLLCATVLTKTLAVFHKKSLDFKRHSWNKDIQILASSLLERLVGCILSLDRCSVLLGDLVSCLFQLLRLMSSSDYEIVLEAIKSCSSGKKRLKDFLLRLFLIFRDMVKVVGFSQHTESNAVVSMQLFPLRWGAMRLCISNIILLAMQELSDTLCAEFLHGPSFDYQLWSTYFNLCASFITQPALQLENKTTRRAEAVVDHYEDMRVLMCFQLTSLWNHLGSKQSYFVPSMIGPLLEISLVPPGELRKTTIPIFYDLLYKRAEHVAHCREIETEFFDKLDVLFSESKGDYEYKVLFGSILSQLMNAKLRSETRDRGLELVKKLEGLMEMLLDYRHIPDGEDNLNKRLACLLNLLNFYRTQSEKSDIYLRYVYRMHDLLLLNGSVSEAASVLKLYADSLTWSRANLPQCSKFPVQPEWQRKEELVKKIINYYDRAKFWERAIALSRQLAVFYEQDIFDLQKLSTILRRTADFYDKILITQHREIPCYFRVAFHGQPFPAFVRNKVFIFRGQPYENIGAFTSRLASEWPQATILNNTAVLNEDTFSVAAQQYMQLCHVKPVPEKVALLNSYDAPENVKSYYRANEVHRFQYSRPLTEQPSENERSRGSMKANDFQNLWTERTTMFVSSDFPGIVPWAAVVREFTETVSPVQNACASVQEKNDELRRLCEQCSTRLRERTLRPTVRKRDLNQHLLMVLKGTIEAAVNGGIAMYQQAFFTPDFCARYPTEVDQLLELRRLLWEQMQLLERGLQLNSQLVSDDCRPLQEHLLKCYDRLRRDVKKSLDSPRIRRLIAGGSNKLSLPSSPEQSSISGARPQPSGSNLLPSPVTLMAHSWDPAFAGDQSESDISISVGRSENEDDALLPGFLGSDLMARRRKSKQRPFSVHWESSIESVASSEMAANLSDSNLTCHLGGKRPSRLRRLMSRLGSVGSGSASPRTPDQSPRTSVDKGLHKMVRRARTKSPQFSRKLSAPFLSNMIKMPYQTLKSPSLERGRLGSKLDNGSEIKKANGFKHSRLSLSPSLTPQRKSSNECQSPTAYLSPISAQALDARRSVT